MAPPIPAARPGLLPASAAFALLISILVSVLAGASVPTPLYGVYQAAWGFSPFTTTLVFAVYAVAVLASLLTIGSLSDHVGRRPLLLAVLLASAVTMLLFARASGVADLLVARLVQGLATGGALGALGAGLVDLDRAKGTIANAVAGPLGTATGGLVSGLFVQYLPAPTHLVYWVMVGVFGIQAIGIAFMAETSEPTAGAWASLRPRLALPPATRRPFLFAAPALVALWALAGFSGRSAPRSSGSSSARAPSCSAGSPSSPSRAPAD